MTEVTSQNDTTMIEDNSGTRPVFDTTSNPSPQDSKDVIVGIRPTPQAKVVANDLIMRTIFDFIEERGNLLKVMLLCASLSSIAARLIYKTCAEGELTKVWTRGCSLDRFAVYLSGVRILHLKTPPCGLDLKILMQRYHNLSKIIMTPRYEEDRSLLALEEVYTYAERRILIRSEREPHNFNFASRGFRAQSDHVTYEGIRSMEADGELFSFEDIWTTRIASVLETSEGSALFKNVQRLALRHIPVSLTHLETILTRCSRLTILHCKLDSNGFSEKSDRREQQREYLNGLKELMKGPDAGLQQLDIDCAGPSVLQFLEALQGCPIIRLEGCQPRPSITRWRNVWVASQPDTERRTRECELALSFVSKWESAIPDPYAIARTARSLLTPGCALKVGLRCRGDLSQNHEFWMRIFEAVMKTLEEEDRLSRKEGWKMVRAVADGK